tara:strand:+ start:4458 stop:4901 length:444 start_codon:yes stop_codon:yes gene_type:complete
MSKWWNLIKGPDNHLEVIEDLFSNPEKAIGYIPVDWGVGKENEIQALASRLGLQYKVFPKLKQGTPNPRWHSYANGGHFMWDENKVNAILEETDFKSAGELVAFIAHNDYRSKPYRRVIDKIFGTPDVTLVADKRDNRMKGIQRGFE